ncbi:hypothetical protein Tco_0763409 [Tanacetum coccineum]
MAFSVILISSDSSEESIRTSTARVILFGTIPTTIPPTTPTINLLIIHDETLMTPIISPTIPPVAPTIQYTSSFINTDSSDSDTPDSPSSQDPYKTTVAQWRSRVATRSSPPSSLIRQILPALPRLPRRPAVLCWIITYPSTCIEIPIRFLFGFFFLTFFFWSLSVPVSSPVRGALSPVRADLSPPPKRIRDFDSVTDLEVSSVDGYEPYVPIEAGLGVDVEDSYKPYTEPDIDTDIQADIDECIAYVDAIRARGMDDRDVVETAAKEEVEFRERDTVKVEIDPRVGPVIEDDVRESVREDVLDHVITDGAVEVTYETLGGLV